MIFVRKLLLPSSCLVSLLTTANVLAHQGSLNQIPWVACEEKSLDDACEFYNAQEDKFRGTCQSISEVLMCVRNQPIEYASDVESDHSHDDEHSQAE